MQHLTMKISPIYIPYINNTLLGRRHSTTNPARNENGLIKSRLITLRRALSPSPELDISCVCYKMQLAQQ